MNNSKTVSFRLSETTYNNMLSVCEVMGVKPSEFMRMAVNQYVIQASTQTTCVNLAKLIKNIQIDGVDKEKAEQLEQMLLKVGNFCTGE